MWSRPPDFLIFTGAMVYLVRLFQDTKLALRATEVRTGRQGSNIKAEGCWRRALFIIWAAGNRLGAGAATVGGARLRERRARVSAHRAIRLSRAQHATLLAKLLGASR